MKKRSTWLACALAGMAGAGCESSTGLVRDADRMIQTESLAYDLRSDGGGLGVEIVYTFNNRTGGGVYLANCNGGFGLVLERQSGEAWHAVWSPILPACLSPPIVIEKDAPLTDTLRVWGALPGGNAFPQFQIANPGGTYRLVWTAAFSSYEDDHRHGPAIPLEARTSNRFILRVQ